MRKLLKNESGATALEYAILIAVIAIIFAWLGPIAIDLLKDYITNEVSNPLLDLIK